MAERRPSGLGELLERWAVAVAAWTGSSQAFGLALLAVLIWAVTGPLFRYSEAWQLTINTGTTIVTFLMVFLIQRSQNKDTRAIELKLNELVAAMEGASNRLISVEDLSEADLEKLHARYQELAEKAQREGDSSRAHSLDEAARDVGETKERKKKTQPAGGRAANGVRAPDGGRAPNGGQRPGG